MSAATDVAQSPISGDGVDKIAKSENSDQLALIAGEGQPLKTVTDGVSDFFRQLVVWLCHRSVPYLVALNRQSPITKLCW